MTVEESVFNLASNTVTQGFKIVQCSDIIRVAL